MSKLLKRPEYLKLVALSQGPVEADADSDKYLDSLCGSISGYAHWYWKPREEGDPRSAYRRLRTYAILPGGERYLIDHPEVPPLEMTRAGAYFIRYVLAHPRSVNVSYVDTNIPGNKATRALLYASGAIEVLTQDKWPNQYWEVTDAGREAYYLTPTGRAEIAQSLTQNLEGKVDIKFRLRALVPGESRGDRLRAKAEMATGMGADKYAKRLTWEAQVEDNIDRAWNEYLTPSDRGTGIVVEVGFYGQVAKVTFPSKVRIVEAYEAMGGGYRIEFKDAVISEWTLTTEEYARRVTQVALDLSKALVIYDRLSEAREASYGKGVKTE